MKRSLLLIVLILAVIFGIGMRVALFNKATAPSGSTEQSANPAFNKNTFSTTDPKSIWFLVNKQNALPDGYKPADLVVPDVSLFTSELNDEMHLRRAAAVSLEKLFAAASRDKLKLVLVSGFRSQSLQALIFNSFSRSFGETEANRSSAKPGHSEHQTGLASDIGAASHQCRIQECFGEMAEGKWLAKNAHKYGFIVRYPSGKEKVTGYMYEPWHFRYVGIDLATEMKNQKVLTLEEFFADN